MYKPKVMISLVCAGCCLLAQKASLSQESAVFTLQATTKKSETRNPAEQVISVTITNTSPDSIYVVFSGPTPAFTLDVRDQQGKAVKETAHGMTVHGTGPITKTLYGSYSALPIASGASFTRDIPIGKEYDLSEPGIYRVSASRNDGNGVIVKSNETSITVLPH